GNYGGQGSLVAFDTLMDKYGPNTKAALAKYPDIKKGITTEDGKIYALPQIYTYDEKLVGYKMYLNKKWLDKLGLQLPQTTDDYYKVLKAFKEKDPNGNGKADEIPYTSDASFKLFTLLKGSWGLANRGPLNTPDVVNYDLDPKTSNVRFLPTDAGYKSILEYCAKLFSEKLIDSDMFTIKAQSADLAAKTTTDIIGSFISTNKNDVNVKFTGDFVLVPPLKGPNGDQLYTDVRSMLDEGAFSITSKNKYPNETMKWVDYFYSVEGGRLLEMGVEGKTYNKKASGGFEYSEFITKNPNGLSFNNAVGLISTAITAVSPHIATKEDNQFLTPEVIKETEEVKKYAIKENWNSLRFTNKEQEKLKELDTEINKYINEMRAKFVSGSESIDTGWTKYTETFKKLKVDEVLAIYKAATERLKK
ncbi:MAG: ABC transporter substrate-binding protein, partial [Clostridiaceae bacterium]|nr:ABC transporter substrate-binding protein [Clostridiaceae bacterium]